VLVTLHGGGSPPAPLAVDACALGEPHEGRLVKVQHLVINPHADITFAGNTSYKAANCYTDSVEMFVDADTNIPGTPITTTHLEVIGIAGQFDSSAPYDYWYQVQPRSLGDITFLSMTSAEGPRVGGGAELWPAAPNPFGRTTEIRYRIPAAAHGEATVQVRLALYDLSGRTIATLVDGPVTPGVHTAIVDREALDSGGSGIVFCRLQAGAAVLTRKLVLMR
jgi:hypothetical protein